MTPSALAAMIGSPVTALSRPRRINWLAPLDWLARFMLFAIRMYRLLLAPVLPPSCRYLPSCSHYAEEAIRTWGPFRGGALAAWRIARCHPFCTAGVDPVPARGKKEQPETVPLG